MKNVFGYCNGKIKNKKDISVSPYDLGFLRAYSIFDVCRTTKDGKILLLEEHYKRTVKASKDIGLNFNLSKKEFEDIIYKLMKKNGLKKTIIRTIVSGGESKDGFTFSGKTNILIFLEKFILPTKKDFEEGVNVVILEYNREIPKIKTTNYLKAVKNQKNKIKARAFENIYIDNNKVLEASTANIFIIKNKKIITPKDGILHGTVRNLVIDLLQKEGFNIQEKNVSLKNLMNADEVFLTATNKNVLPVRKIDNTVINRGRVGEVTKKIMEIYNNFENNY